MVVIVFVVVLGVCIIMCGLVSVLMVECIGQFWVVICLIIVVQVFDICLWFSFGCEVGWVLGYWVFSWQQVDQLEVKLLLLEVQVLKVLDFDCQYVGIESVGKWLIYVNVFYLFDDSGINLVWEVICVCDGGMQFWGVVFDFVSNIFSELQFNGGFGGF